MPANEGPRKHAGLDMAEFFGADLVSSQQLVLYLPDKDRDGNDVGGFQDYVERATRLLATIGRGVTIETTRGVWINDRNEHIHETTTRIYTYIQNDSFISSLKEIRQFVQEFGLNARQEAVFLEFDGDGFHIYDFGEES